MGLSGIDPAALLAFAGTAMLIELTPGPNMVYLAVVAASQGRRLGFAAVAGVALGLALVGVAAALGLAAIINASPTLFQALRFGGVAYMLWLAWDAWRDADEPVKEVAGGIAARTYFRRGMITNLLNPKAAVFYVAILPSFVSPGTTVMSQTLALSAVFVLVATTIHAIIVAMAGTAQVLLEDEKRSQFIRRALALALVGVALWFGWSTTLSQP
ncbi:threonine/homoserine/homoserine lactone efflux protein [Yoonia maritima]|uniref:Threonine/homoserine/homoserine lactone efflux protein n=1 Tax=Yoonia maritima TaxID=1435347 RepID=A0A2T0W0I2_9RHOB|nr:LysE family translocator [Yoonia maritima]PRY78128.1 threonine/homoserine/homoserine lactone efflux protein [Yoonia maritima]